MSTLIKLTVRIAFGSVFGLLFGYVIGRLVGHYVGLMIGHELAWRETSENFDEPPILLAHLASNFCARFGAVSSACAGALGFSTRRALMGIQVGFLVGTFCLAYQAMSSSLLPDRKDFFIAITDVLLALAVAVTIWATLRAIISMLCTGSISRTVLTGIALGAGIALVGWAYIFTTSPSLDQAKGLVIGGLGVVANAAVNGGIMGKIGYSIKSWLWW
jgi:hypothetical protein